MYLQGLEGGREKGEGRDRGREGFTCEWITRLPSIENIHLLQLIDCRLVHIVPRWEKHGDLHYVTCDLIQQPAGGEGDGHGYSHRGGNRLCTVGPAPELCFRKQEE